MKIQRLGLWLFMATFMVTMQLSAQNKHEGPYSDKEAWNYAQNTVQRMSLEQKVGQMTQISLEFFLKTKDGQVIVPHVLDTPKLKEAIEQYHVGSILNVGGDAQTVENWRGIITEIQNIAMSQSLKVPILYGIDAIHGNNYTLGSVMFPQQIAMAASFNPDLIKRAGEVSAYETRASFIPWNFSPVLDLGRMPVWPRIWETFGEDPYLVSVMGDSIISGYQGNNMADKYHVAACLKHFMGYSMPLSGHDRTPAWIPERELREYFLPQFKSAIDHGALTVMVNSGEINGVPVHANHHILTDILKGELRFKGFAVSDWQDIEYLWQRHHVAKDNKDAVKIAVNAGIDMSMVPVDYSFSKDLLDLAKSGEVSEGRINDAVTRILYVKYKLGLFDRPIGNASDYSLFGGKEHQQLNYDVASECVTLLKNKNNILPLKKGIKILVTGPAANTMRSLNGGWARVWQGTTSDETEKDKNTILEALQQRLGNQVLYAPGTEFDSSTKEGIQAAVDQANSADLILFCGGESSYTETPGNINDLTISSPQIQLVKALAKTGKPMVMVLTEGRPRIVSAIEPFMQGIIDALYPGNQGGNVIADILLGKINPSGKLPYTYPRFTNALANYYHKYTESKEFDINGGYDPQWEFGYGLSYTTFDYSDLQLSSTVVSDNRPLQISVTVKNTGDRKGKETVLVYASDLVASITPEVKRLRAFKKVELQPGGSQTLHFTLSKKDLSFINNDLKRVTEPGDFTLEVGGLKQSFVVQ
ncbi:beta-glucosidase [Arachidicoccus rhizosphaerae]|uniref:beta-glucosidase n=1 Tax=Arachidicoccus rhizosphaerae TaxID=551991 RepID=A0A1H3WHZ5_9BACT|nr:glycoside hydrolase family 3 N-terminal domain-containing protein [Arachidicoccus rhizosphaerae]SDZ86735.1 beta-glucosidase [Arachidicoccus rhizosphaerae]